MSQYQRTKGHNWERKTAAWFRDRGFPKAKRGLQTQPSYKPPDIEGTPWWVECKIGARPNILGAMKQARRDLQEAQEGGFGGEYVGGVLVVAKADNEAPTVTMDLETFGALLEAYLRVRTNNLLVFWPASELPLEEIDIESRRITVPPNTEDE